MLSVIYVECHIYALYIEWHYAECRYAECRGSEVYAPAFYKNVLNTIKKGNTE